MIQANIGPGIMEFINILNNNWLSIWKPGGVLVIDESMWEFLGYSPNHVNIPRKPHPNGHLAYQLAGYTGNLRMPMVYCLSPHVFGNKLPPRGQARRLMELFPRQDYVVHLVCDSAFGSFDEALYYHQNGVSVTYSMNSDPKAYLWDLLAFDCPSESGRVAVVPLAANGVTALASYYCAIDDKGKINDLRTLSTSFDWQDDLRDEDRVAGITGRRDDGNGGLEYDTLWATGKREWLPASSFMDDDGTFTVQFLQFAEERDIKAALDGLTVAQLEVICEAQNFSVRPLISVKGPYL